jgi:ESX secretion-associated protein EspK
LWFAVVKPMTSHAAGREAAQLHAFHTYAAHAHEEAHNAADPTARRGAIADWFYWKHLAGLLDHALADMP